MDENKNKQHEERAVRDAQKLVAYTAKKGLDVDQDTLKTLLAADEKWDSGAWTPEFASDFWKAFGKVSQLIKPATVDSVRAICLDPKEPGFWGFLTHLFGRSPARRSTNTFIIFTLGVLFVLLFFQVYWVIGNSLATRLTQLLDNETQLTASIDDLEQDYSEVELRFKITEEDTNIEEKETESASQTGDRSYNFYYTPDWERETLLINNQINRMENQLESIKKQLDRNHDLLWGWALFWRSWLQIKFVNEELISQKNDLNEQIEAKQKAINEVPDDIQRTDLDELNKRLISLTRQIELETTKETSYRARLVAGVVLDILQSYILPLLYGLLGASAFVLRTMTREILDVTYSVASNGGYILRLVLGTLAGLIVGWFIFLLPGQTILAAISPFAIAFLVGYNIELLFSVMDNIIDRLRGVGKRDEEPQKPEKDVPEVPGDSVTTTAG